MRTNEAAQLTERWQVGCQESGEAGEVENKMKMGKKVTDRQHQLNELKDGKASWLAEPQG